MVKRRIPLSMNGIECGDISQCDSLRMGRWGQLLTSNDFPRGPAKKILFQGDESLISSQWAQEIAKIERYFFDKDCTYECWIDSSKDQNPLVSSLKSLVVFGRDAKYIAGVFLCLTMSMFHDHKMFDEAWIRLFDHDDVSGLGENYWRTLDIDSADALRVSIDLWVNVIESFGWRPMILLEKPNSTHEMDVSLLTTCLGDIGVHVSVFERLEDVHQQAIAMVNGLD